MSEIAISGAGNTPDANIKRMRAAGQFPPDGTVSNDQKKLAVDLGEALRLVLQILLTPM